MSERVYVLYVVGGVQVSYRQTGQCCKPSCRRGMRFAIGDVVRSQSAEKGGMLIAKNPWSMCSP